MQIELTNDEAIVLDGLCQRFSEQSRTGDVGVLLLEDQAEVRALWNLCCLIEREIGNHYTGDYQTALRLARNRLRDPT